MKRTKKSDWLYIPVQTDIEWMGQWIMAALAWEFYKKNKRWPTKFKGDSIVVKGHTIAVEME